MSRWRDAHATYQANWLPTRLRCRCGANTPGYALQSTLRRVQANELMSSERLVPIVNAFATSPTGARYQLNRTSRTLPWPDDDSSGNTVICQYLCCTKDLPEEIRSVSFSAIEPFTPLTIEWETERPLN